MLSESTQMQIAAYAAGDGAPSQRSAVREMLTRSAEARALFHSLRVDADALRRLPRHDAPPELVESIRARLPQAATPYQRPSRRSSRLHELASVATVATVLAVVCVGTWWAIQRVATTETASVARRDGAEVRIIERDDRRASAVAAPAAVVPPPSAPAVAAGTPEPAATLQGPSTAPPRGELAAPPSTNMEIAQVVPPRLPSPFAIRALDQEDVRPRLFSELTGGDAHRIDVFSRDSARAAERLQAALKQHGVRVLVDAAALDLQKRRVRSMFAVFCDDLTALEWADVLRTMAVADRLLEDKKPGDGVFDQLVVMPLGPADHKELLQWLGQDPLMPQAANATPAVKTAIVAPIPPPRPSASGSKEIRQFLDERHERLPGAVSVLLLFRLPG